MDTISAADFADLLKLAGNDLTKVGRISRQQEKKAQANILWQPTADFSLLDNIPPRQQLQHKPRSIGHGQFYYGPRPKRRPYPLYIFLVGIAIASWVAYVHLRMPWPT